MRNIYLSIFLLFFFNGMAQGPDLPVNKSVSVDPAVKQTVLHIDGLDFDYRVLRRYDEQTLKGLPASKRKQLYFLYTASYTVIHTGSCPDYDLRDLDLASLESFRKMDEPAIVETGGDCRVLVQLMSVGECRQKMDELAK